MLPDNLRHLRIGQHRLRCFACADSRRPEHQSAKTLGVLVEPNGFIRWNCFHCGESGAASANGPANIAMIRTIPPKIGHNNLGLTTTRKINANVGTAAKIMNSTIDVINFPSKINDRPNRLDEAAFSYLRSRGISRETCEHFGIFGTNYYIRELGDKVPCVAFPYKNESYKMRAIEDKGFASYGSFNCLFGIEHICEGETKRSEYEPNEIVITEGEIDALSLYEAGIKNPVSIPAGAGIKGGDGEVSYLWDARERLASAARIILALDADGPGQAAAEEIARRIGRHKCWRVVWPYGCKDANDVLTKLGAEELVRLVDDAEPWPVSGLYDARHFYDEVVKAKQSGFDRGYRTGYPTLDGFYSICPALLTVVTGNPGSGKSEFVDQLMFNSAIQDGWTFAICSFENTPHIHISKLMSKKLKKSFWNEDIPDIEFDEAYQWVQDHFCFLHHADGSLASIDDIIERLRAAVMRYGIRGAVIDPYNYILRERDDKETDWISSMLTKIKTFCMAHDVHIWFVAHPTKMHRSADGSYPIPKGYDISGSAAWFAKADFGLTVHRSDPSNNIADIHIWKVRFAWTGKVGSCSLLYRPETTNFTDLNDEVIDDPWEENNNYERISGGY